MLTRQSKDLLLATARAMISSKTFFRTYYKKPFFYENKYFGKFDYHDQIKYPKGLCPIKEEELLDEVHAIRAKQIDNPSPFHIVRRIRTMNGLPWNQKVTLRRLNLHSSQNGDCVVVPNTPQYNALIAKVKHLIQLKPAKFVDGRIPNEEDIGAVKVCPFTGNVQIDEKLRLQSGRLNLEPPLLFRGNLLRNKIGRSYGINNRHYLK